PGAFVLYASTPAAVYRYDTSVMAASGSLLVAAPAGAVYRGVALPPTTAAYLQPTAFISGTPSPSSTASHSATLSPGASPSATGSAASTVSASQTPSAARTPPNTPSNSPSPSNAMRLFQPTSVVVTRVGDAYWRADLAQVRRWCRIDTVSVRISQ